MEQTSPTFRHETTGTTHSLTESVQRAHDTAPRLLYSRKDAARLLSISTRSLDYLIVKGTLNTRRIGSRVLIEHEELIRLASHDHHGSVTA
jgi:hypothetical protein